MIIKVLSLIAAFLVSASFAERSYAVEKVRIGMANSWPGYAMSWLAAKKGLASDVEFEFVIQEDPLTGYALLASGQLDMYMSTIEYIPIAAEQNLPIVFVTTTNPSYGVDQIVLQPNKKPEDIKGGKIAAPEAYIGQLFASFWLHSIGIGASEVEWVNLRGDEVIGPMISGDLDATYVYEPWTSKMVDAIGGAKIVADTQQPNIISSGLFTEVIYMNRDFLKNRRSAAKAALKSYWEGAGYWHQNTAESNKYFADLLGWPAIDIDYVIGTNGKYVDGGIWISAFDEAARICGVLDGEHPLGIKNGSVGETVTLVRKYWRDLGLVKSDVDIGNNVDCSLMQELVDDGYRQSFSAR